MWERRCKSNLTLARYLNLAQAYKWSGDNEKCKKLLDERNWGTDEKFKLAEAVLRDDYDLAQVIMKRVGNKIHPFDGESAYRTWPIFQEFRKTNNFRKAFKEVYGKEYEYITANEVKPPD